MTPPDAPAPPLIVVGASVRALAASAKRAGWAVHAADLFADADLRAVAIRAVRVPTAPHCPWPRGLESCVRRFPVAPWVYGGALENHPDLVDRLARVRPLAGNAGERLRAVRDPALLAAAVRAAGLAFPETHDDAAGLPTDGTFLCKPRASGGGRGVARWYGGHPRTDGRLWQRFVPGRAWSASYALGGDATLLRGASRQFVGRSWCGARGFAWCGAVDVPLGELPGRLREPLERLGTALAGICGLRGMVGVDFIVDAAGVPHVIEVNPRPTASMELVERATGMSVAATHLAGWGHPGPTARPPTPPARPARWAKAVVFATRTVAVAADTAAALRRLGEPWDDADGGWPALADVPAVGATIAAGRPALTVFAAGHDATDAVRLLRGRVAAVRRALESAAVSPPTGAARSPRPPAPGSSA